jgi:hypothetical protein
MGFHVGIIGAGCRWEPLRAGLEGRAASFQPVEYRQDDEDWSLEVNEHPRGTLLIDQTLWLSQNFDLFVELSATLQTTIAAYYGETVSGSYGIVVAKGGRVRRLYHRCNATTRGELSLGTPYASEAIDPLDEINGNGGIAVINHYGFFVDDALVDQLIPRRYHLERRFHGEKGPVTRVIERFEADNNIPEEQRPGITAIGRILEPGEGAGGAA